jgi:predicted metal-dependent hydrolase
MSENDDVVQRFEEGIKKFNECEFYDCHDILEDVWFEIRGSSRRFYQGLIHLAVGFHHLTRRNNLNGTLSQLNKGIIKLSDYSPEFQGVEVKDLLKRVSGCINDVNEMKEGKIKEFDFGKIPTIKFKRVKFKSPQGSL